jgi:GGDEF domain-containing protein
MFFRSTSVRTPSVTRAGQRPAICWCSLLTRANLALRQLFFPNGLLVLCALAALWFVPRGSAYPAGARWICIGILVGTALLATRLHSLRAFLVVLSLLSLLLWLIFGAAAPGALHCAIALLAVDVVAIALLAEDSFFDWIAITWWTAFLIVQWATFAALIRWTPALIQAVSNKTVETALGAVGVIEIILAVCAVLLLARFFFKADAVGAGMFWVVIALVFRRPAGAELYVALAGAAVAVAIIERSHWIAYHDELTGLPGRRAFNEALAGVGRFYSVAVVDVDHFKNFNDTFGHDTGDQVLRNVAAHLARVAKGKGFRCGGEEFAIVYDGLPVEDALVEAEKVRRSIEEDVFVARGPARSTRKRTDRRVNAKMSRRRKAVETNVTVSIGVAASQSDTYEPQDVVKAADRALYSAKHLGRNRVEAAESPKRKKSAQAVN